MHLLHSDLQLHLQFDYYSASFHLLPTTIHITTRNSAIAE